ncbi:MAG: hypothetical protein ACRELS_04070 [Candidatus Rokuibacteriota bacterium]
MRRADHACGAALVAFGVLSLVETLRVKDERQGATVGVPER